MSERSLALVGAARGDRLRVLRLRPLHLFLDLGEDCICVCLPLGRVLGQQCGVLLELFGLLAERQALLPQRVVRVPPPDLHARHLLLDVGEQRGVGLHRRLGGLGGLDKLVHLRTQLWVSGVAGQLRHLICDRQLRLAVRTLVVRRQLRRFLHRLFVGDEFGLRLLAFLRRLYGLPQQLLGFCRFLDLLARFGLSFALKRLCLQKITLEGRFLLCHFGVKLRGLILIFGDLFVQNLELVFRISYFQFCQREGTRCAR
mmetsp:Transcript_8475/g.16637  ORF Transcript_8475/g.16637 Transcript_8475/m.16637 type:complete len:257 (-) Transcript_8475:212-982(-)